MRIMKFSIHRTQRAGIIKLYILSKIITFTYSVIKSSK